MPALKIRQVMPEDLQRCYNIETQAYQGDEAASREKIATRINTYPQGFIVAEVAGVVVGFINCGACHEVILSDEDFKELIGHDADGKNIVIMSVVVHPDYQRQAYATQLMTDFINRMKKLHKHSIHLICQTHLVDFYAKHGFAYIGESTSEHGGLSWHEMVLDLGVG